MGFTNVGIVGQKRYVTNGLVLDYEFNTQNSLPTFAGSLNVLDLSGNRYTSFKNTSLLLYQPNFGGSLNVNNSGYYISRSGGYIIGNNNADFTIEYWVYPTTLTTSQSYLWSASSNGYTSLQTTQIVLSDNTNQVSWTGLSLSANNGYQIVITRSGNDFTLYINNVSQGVKTANLLFGTGTATRYYIGRSSAVLVGYYLLTRWYNRALSTQELTVNFNSDRGRFNI